MSGARIRPAGRGVLALIGVVVLGAGSYLAGMPELLYAAALVGCLGVIGLVQILLTTAGRRPEVVRDVSTAAPFADRSFGVDLVVTGGRGLAGAWRDRLSEHLSGVAHGDRAAQNGRTHYEVVAHRRGWHTLGPLEIMHEDPFALWRARRVAGRSSDVLVLPAMEMLGEDGPAQPGGDTPEFAQAGTTLRDPDIIPREYRPGDPLSRIHWKATARRDALMVRDDERKADLSALIVLDLRRSGEPDAVERAVSMAASVVTHLVDRGYTVRLRGLGCAPRIDCEVDSATGLLDAMRALAVVEPGGGVAAPPRGGVRLAALIGPRPSPWPLRAPIRLLVGTAAAGHADAARLDTPGWRSTHFDHTGSATATWRALGTATGARRA